jgi:GNAT superfamily N-acetyltransferase
MQTDAAKIDVVQFGDTDESAVRQAYAVWRDAWIAAIPDIPPDTLASFIADIARPSTSYGYERALAYLNGVPAGYLMLQLPLKDNLGNAEVDLMVAAAHRRQGVGRALYEHAAVRLRALGRKRLIGNAVQSETGGTGFCTAIGATPALEEKRSRLDLTTIDQDRLDAMLAEAWTHADGYRLLFWDGVPPYPYIDHVAYLDSRFMSDAPTGELDWEPENVDAERVRQSEQRRIDQGMSRFHAGMVHEASDRLVAWTNLGGAHDIPTHLWQNVTIVDPPHRGHRLGLIVKLENLRRARAERPELTAIDTFNASSNQYMLAINVAMGFRPVDTWMEWQATV